MDEAPFYSTIADGPKSAAAFWRLTRDGVRVRTGAWNTKTGKAHGTVLILPGRTEYLEKYGRAARDFTSRGFACVAIDWRGQGLADRLIEDPFAGHVLKFTDYQIDFDELLGTATALKLPEPYYLLGHSMGGAIGMQALSKGYEPPATMFSAPMWGIELHPLLRPAAWFLSSVSDIVGQSHRYAPTTSGESYLFSVPFEENMLTTDREMFEYMRDHLSEVPELIVGGPTLRWLGEALRVAERIRSMAPVDLPLLTWLGTNDRIVDQEAIKARMSTLPNGELQLVSGGEHEVMMEGPETRKRVFDDTTAFFKRHR